MHKTVFVWADTEELFNSSHHRIFTPAKYLRRAGYNVLAIPIGVYEPELMASHTVLIERALSPDIVLRARRAGARRIVATFDDAYKYIPEGVAQEYWKRNHDSFVRALGMVDEAIVPSRALADEYRRDCPKITVVPNYLDDDLWDFPPRKHAGAEGVVIGYGGSVHHYHSWKNGVLAAALARLQKRYAVCVELMGYAGREALVRGGVKFRLRPPVSMQEWPVFISGLDIGLAPLDGIYDSFRSHLKAQEYGAAWVPWVGTSSRVYSDARGGVTVRNSEREWYDALEKLLDPNFRQALAEEGASWSRSLYMSRNVSVYADILEITRKSRT